VVEIIRAKLADPSVGKGAANHDDLAALQTFYARAGAPVWMTEMGFSAKGQAALFEIGNADDWGLDASAFDLPPANALPKTPEDQALTEIKLDLAIMKYARFARGGQTGLEQRACGRYVALELCQESGDPQRPPPRRRPAV